MFWNGSETLAVGPVLSKETTSNSNCSSEKILTRGGCAADASAVTTHDFRAGMLPQPSGYRVGLTIPQQVNDLACLEIEEDRTVVMALLPCPVIVAKRARSCYR